MIRLRFEMFFEREHDGERDILAPVAGDDLHADGQSGAARLDFPCRSLNKIKAGARSLSSPARTPSIAVVIKRRLRPFHHV
jgi:hypothetical protein